jgi:protein-tyrosine phosphatase
MTIAAWILFAPYFIVTWLNSRLWTYRHPQDSLILQLNGVDLYLGRIPSKIHNEQYDVLFDCCAELAVIQHVEHYDKCSSLDLIPIQSKQLLVASEQFNRFIQLLIGNNEQGKALIFCALGYSRSCSILIAWLLRQEHVSSVEDAIVLIQRARPWIVLSEAHIAEIKHFQVLLAAERQQ